MANRPYRSEHDGYRDIVKDFSTRYRYSAYGSDPDLAAHDNDDDYDDEDSYSSDPDEADDHE